MIYSSVIEQMRNYADQHNVPIMTDDGINYLMNYIRKHKIKNILEIGTAIGYSAILMCSVSEDVFVTTIERDEKRYLEAVKNIKSAKLEDRINLICKDALDTNLGDAKYDLIFIDAAKAQNINFFEKFELNLVDGGTIITDNMNFHGLVYEDDERIESRNLRQLVRKVRNYKDFLNGNKYYRTEFLDIGDGLAISVKR